MGDQDRPVSANWGGSTDAVLKASKTRSRHHSWPCRSTRTKSSALRFATQQFLFPATNEDPGGPQRSPGGGRRPPRPEGGRVSGDLQNSERNFGSLAFMDYVCTQVQRSAGRGVRRQMNAVAGLRKMTGEQVAGREDQGFTGLASSRFEDRAPSGAAGTAPAVPKKVSPCPGTSTADRLGSRQTTAAGGAQGSPPRSSTIQNRIHTNRSFLRDCFLAMIIVALVYGGYLSLFGEDS